LFNGRRRHDGAERPAATTLTPRQARWLAWLVGVLVVPVPMLVVGPGLVPPLRMAELGLALALVAVLESGAGMIGLLIVVLLGQALVWAGVWWWLAGRLALWPRVVPVVVAVLLVVALVAPVYRTPYHARLARCSLLEVYR
jgi:hypothetical protein